PIYITAPSNPLPLYSPVQLIESPILTTISCQSRCSYGNIQHELSPSLCILGLPPRPHGSTWAFSRPAANQRSFLLFSTLLQKSDAQPLFYQLPPHSSQKHRGPTNCASQTLGRR